MYTLITITTKERYIQNKEIVNREKQENKTVKIEYH